MNVLFEVIKMFMFGKKITKMICFLKNYIRTQIAHKQTKRQIQNEILFHKFNLNEVKVKDVCKGKSSLTK